MTNFNWYFTREELDNKSPSREDGVTQSTEIRYRREGARLIINASNTLGLRYETTATGVVFFHRFFMIQSFRQFSRWVVASACLLLAGKVEETPKKCRDIIKVCQSLLTEQQMAHFGSNPKDELTTHERILLQTIKFDLQVEHPYAYLLKFAKQLQGEKSKIEKLVQMAWTFMNDSLCTSLCLQWEPQAVAIAFIYLAGKLSKFDLVTATQSKSRSWWRQYLDTVDIHDLESICHQVLDIYGEDEHKSGEEGGVLSEATPHSTPSTPHSAHQQPIVTSAQYSQIQQTAFPPTPTVPQPPTTVHQQYATHYQQLPTGTVIPQQSQTSYGGQAIPPSQAILHGTPTTLAQPANAPLAYSTLNVNVSSLTPSHATAGVQQPPSTLPGAVAGTVGTVTGSYQYPPSFPAPTSPATQQQQRSFATGANAYPIQNVNKAMTSSFIGSGSGQAGLTRPVGVASAVNLGASPRGGAVGRGSTNSTPPLRAPNPIPTLTPSGGYPGLPPTTVGGVSAAVSWPT